MLWLAGATNPKTKTSGLPFPHGKSCKSKSMVAGTPVAGQATYQGHLLGSYSTPTSWTPKWQTFRTVFSLCKVPSLVLFHVSGYWTSRGMFWLNLFWKPWHREQNEGLHLLYESFPVRLCLNPKTPSDQGHHGELYKVHDGNLPKKSMENPSDDPLLFHDVPNLSPTRLAEIK